MGLDTVELVMEIEETFGITIPDDEASRMITVGDVFDCIMANTRVSKQPTVCLSAIAFYSLRRAAKSLGATQRLRPSDSILSLLPNSKRRQYWAQLQKCSELELPPLCRPSWLVLLCTLVTAACSAYIGAVAYQANHSQLAAVVSALTSGICVGALVGLLTRPFAVYPAKHCATCRDLAEAALGLNFKKLSERYYGANASDVWIALRSMIVEQLGVSPEEVTPTASFVKDLGCG
jgi:acyl carrier protein